MKNTIKALAIAASVFAVQSTATAAQSFDFQDPKGVNTIRFSLDAPLESISGTTNGVTGNVAFDIKHPEKTSGTIRVDATSIKVPNPVMLEHLHSENWINSAKYGEIVFETASIENVTTTGDTVKGDITGTLSLHGVSKEVTTPVTLTYLPGKLADRSGGQMEGDLLVLRAQFSINRSEFGIMAGQATDKVAEEIVISLALAGHSAK